MKATKEKGNNNKKKTNKVIDKENTKQKNDNELNVIAYHEAGHAVMASLLGIKIKIVTIDEDKTISELGPENKAFTDYEGGIPDRYFQYLVTHSGSLADNRIDPFFPMSGGDLYHPVNDLSDLDSEMDSYQQMEFCEDYLDAGKIILDYNWHLVKLVAESLLEKKTLSGQEMEKLLDIDPKYSEKLQTYLNAKIELIRLRNILDWSDENLEKTERMLEIFEKLRDGFSLKPPSKEL
jgi:hypothetical protein